MRQFRGKVGFAVSEKSAPGVTREVITERIYRGTVLRNSRNLLDDEKVNSDISANHSISIVADPYAREHFFTIRYVVWAGTYWKVSEVTEKRPRLILRLGEVYRGNKAPTPSNP